MTPLAAGLDGKAMWYLARGTGAVSLAILTASLALGIATSMRWSSRRLPRFVVLGLHRDLSLLGAAFIAAHVATIVLDGYVPIGWIDAVVPFRTPYHPLSVGIGTVSTDLLIALIVTSLLRTRLSYRVWKAVHWASYACWPAALVHGVAVGTDRWAPWMLAVDGVAFVVTVALVLWRADALARAGEGAHDARPSPFGPVAR